MWGKSSQGGSATRAVMNNETAPRLVIPVGKFTTAPLQGYRQIFVVKTGGSDVVVLQQRNRRILRRNWVFRNKINPHNKLDNVSSYTKCCFRCVDSLGSVDDVKDKTLSCRSTWLSLFLRCKTVLNKIYVWRFTFTRVEACKIFENQADPTDDGDRPVKSIVLSAACSLYVRGDNCESQLSFLTQSE